ncbi:MAG: prepilin-type N-terminal cleavage/methylation domain-containing protein [Desulfovibrionaceae bacterium]
MSTVGKSTDPAANGFTLLELAVVLMVVAIAAALVAPSMDLGVRKSGIEAAAECVGSALDQARNYAKLTRQAVTLRFGRTSIAAQDDEKALDLPPSVVFQEIAFAGKKQRIGQELVVSRRGIAPPALVRLRVNDELYSLLVSPVLRDVEYRKGMAKFDDFND